MIERDREWGYVFTGPGRPRQREEDLMPERSARKVWLALLVSGRRQQQPGRTHRAGPLGAPARAELAVRPRTVRELPDGGERQGGRRRLPGRIHHPRRGRRSP